MPDPGVIALPTTQNLRTLSFPCSRLRVVTITNTGIVGSGYDQSVHVDELLLPQFYLHRHDSFVSILTRDQLMQEKYVIMEFGPFPTHEYLTGSLKLNIYGEEVRWISDWDGATGVGYLTYNQGEILTEAIVEVFRVPNITPGNFASSYIPRHQLTDIWTSRDLTREENTEPHEAPFQFDAGFDPTINKLTLLIAFQDYRLGQFIGVAGSQKHMGIDPAGTQVTLDYWDNSGINGFCSDGGLTCDGEKLFMQWNFITGGDGELQPADVELALLSTTSSTSVMGTELVGGGYSRVSLPTGPINGDVTLSFYQNPSPVVFPTATADWSVAGWAIIDSEGRWLFYGNLSEPVLVREGVDFTIDTNDLRVQLYRLAGTNDESFKFLRALFLRDDTLANIYDDFTDTPRLFRFTIYHVEADKELCAPAERPSIEIELSADGHTGTNTAQFSMPVTVAGELDWWRLYRGDNIALVSTSGLHAIDVPAQTLTVGDFVIIMGKTMVIRAN